MCVCLCSPGCIQSLLSISLVRQTAVSLPGQTPVKSQQIDRQNDFGCFLYYTECPWCTASHFILFISSVSFSFSVSLTHIHTHTPLDVSSPAVWGMIHEFILPNIIKMQFSQLGLVCVCVCMCAWAAVHRRLPHLFSSWCRKPLCWQGDRWHGDKHTAESSFIHFNKGKGQSWPTAR